MYRALFSILLFIGTIVPTHTQSSSPEYNEAWRWRQFTTESGLPSNSIHQVFESSEGVIWVVSPEGLAWYDHYRWVSAKRFSDVTDVACILGEQRGKLLVKARDLFLADRQTKPVFLQAGEFARDIYTGYSVVYSDSSVLFIRDRSLFLFHNGTITRYSDPALPPGELFAELVAAAKESFWLFGKSGVYRFSAGTGWRQILEVEKKVFTSTKIAENASGSGITALPLPEGGHVLLEWERHSPPRQVEGERVGTVVSLDIGPDGEAIVVYASGDVRVRTNNVWTSATMPPDVHGVLTVKIQSNSDVWFGTRRGVFLYRRSTPHRTIRKHRSPDARNDINEIFLARNGDLWLGTNDGVDRYSSGGAYEHIGKIDGRMLRIVTGIEQDLDGGIWISSGSSFSGSYRWDGRAWKHVHIGSSTDTAYFHKIRHDRQGRLWFLGIARNFSKVDTMQPGAYVYDNGTFTHWGREQGLPNARVYAFGGGVDGSLWFGTVGGLSRWKDDVWKHWLFPDTDTPRVFTLVVDHQSRVWFASNSSEEKGLKYVDEDDRIQTLGTSDGLLSNRIWDLRVDEAGRILISTPHGINYYQDGFLLTIDHRLGLHHIPVWPLLPSGDSLFVGTLGQGIAILRGYDQELHPPRIEFEEPALTEGSALVRWKALSYWGEVPTAEVESRYRVNGEKWSPWARRSEVQLYNIPGGEHFIEVQSKGLRGEYSRNAPRITFSIPHPLFQRPIVYIPMSLLIAGLLAMAVAFFRRRRIHILDLKKNEENFRAAMENTPCAIIIFSDRRILFANRGVEVLTGYSQDELSGLDPASIFHPGDLPPSELELGEERRTAIHGEYRILASSGEERWADVTIGTIEYRGARVHLATALDISGRKKAEHQLRSLTAELSLTEGRERRRMATFLHDSISQMLVLSRQRLDAIGELDPSLPAAKPLAEIRSFIDQTIENARSLTFELCPPILYDLGLAPAIDWLVDQLKRTHPLDVHVTCDNFQGSLPEPVRDILYAGVRESLMNIIKHARARQVWIDLRQSGDSVLIGIEDDGDGFEHTTTPWGLPESSEGSGFGLMNLHERLTHLGGNLEIESAKGKGTRITLAAPVIVERSQP